MSFYDLSAGPEAWTDDWNVDDADVDFDGVDDYRDARRSGSTCCPRAGLPRGASALTGDLAKVARFVDDRRAVRGLAALPALPDAAAREPLFGEPRPRTRSRARAVARRLRGSGTVYATCSTRSRSSTAGDGLHRSRTTTWPFTSHGAASASRGEFVTFEDLGFPVLRSATLVGHLEPLPFCTALSPSFYAPPRPSFKDGDAGEYEAAPDGTYPSTNAQVGLLTPLGYADDNWWDGTQSGVFSFLQPVIVELGYGLTTTQIHGDLRPPHRPCRTRMTPGTRSSAARVRPGRGDRTTQPGRATSRTRS